MVLAEHPTWLEGRRPCTYATEELPKRGNNLPFKWNLDVRIETSGREYQYRSCRQRPGGLLRSAV